VTNQTQNAVFEAFEDVLKSDEDLELLEKGLRQKLKDAKNSLTSTGSGGSGGSDGRGKPLTTADKLRNAQANRKKATADPNRPELESTLKGERTEIIGARRGAGKVRGALSRAKNKLDQRENAPGAISRTAQRTYAGGKKRVAAGKAKLSSAKTEGGRRAGNVAAAAAGAKSAPAKPTFSNPNMGGTPSSAPKPKPTTGGASRKIDMSGVNLTNLNSGNRSGFRKSEDRNAVWEAFEDAGFDVSKADVPYMGSVKGNNKKASPKVEHSGAAKGADDYADYTSKIKPNKKKSSKDYSTATHSQAEYTTMSKPNKKQSKGNAGKGQTAEFKGGQWQSNNKPQTPKQRRGEGLDEKLGSS